MAEKKKKTPGRICVLGSANADMYIMVDRLPIPGETRSSTPGSGGVKVGGKGLNQAVAVKLASASGPLSSLTSSASASSSSSSHPSSSKYNGEKYSYPASSSQQQQQQNPVHFIGNLGEDTFGPLLRSALTQRGIDASLCQTVQGCASGVALIILQEAGENSIILVGGANLTGWEDFLEALDSSSPRVPSSAADIARSRLECIAESSLLLLQCEVPFQTNYAAARFAKTNGCDVMLDLGGFDPSDFDVSIFRELLLLSANESEILSLYHFICGEDEQVDCPTAEPSPEWAVGLCIQILKKLGPERFPPLLLVTLGGNGSVLIQRRKDSSSYSSSSSSSSPRFADAILEYLPQRTFPLRDGEKVLDTTGAGDCFRGTFAAEFVRQREDLGHCLDMAASAASLCILKMGAMPSYPERQEILDRLASLPGSLCGVWTPVSDPRKPHRSQAAGTGGKESSLDGDHQPLSSCIQERNSKFTGLSAFPLTPFRADGGGEVDEEAFLGLLQRLLEAGVDSITVLGSTGSYPYLSTEQRARIAQLAVQTCGGDIPVFVGVGALRTSDVLQNIRNAEAAGAEGLLLAPMSYQPLTEDDVFHLYRTATQNTRLPVIVYDNPGVTHFRFSLDLYRRIAQLPGIASFKIPGVPKDLQEAKLHISRIRALLPGHITIGVSGDEHAATGLNAGCDAWYSVIGGTLPELALRITRAAQQGRRIDAASEAQRLSPLWELFREFHGSIRVVAVIAEHLGLVGRQPLPLPIRGLSEEQKARVIKVMEELGIAERRQKSPKASRL